MPTATWTHASDAAPAGLPQAFPSSWPLRLLPLAGFFACGAWFIAALESPHRGRPTGIWALMGFFIVHNGWMAAVAWFRPVVRVTEDQVFSYTGLFARRGPLTRPQVLELMEAAHNTRYWDWFRLPWFARRILGQLSRGSRERLASALQQHDVAAVFD